MITGPRVTTAMKLFDVAADGYRHVFARSSLAPLLSRPRPVQLTGYDIPVVVSRITQAARGVRSFELTPVDGSEVPLWQPGAHLDVFLPSGLQRSYSLCGDPGDRSSFRIAVRRIDDGDGGSIEMHSLVEGTQITVRGPRNAFPFRESPSYQFIAAGIGITPILPMVRHAEQSGAPDAAAVLAGGAPGAAIYMCGPPPLMDAARELLTEINPTATLHTERFSPPKVVGGSPFTLYIAGTKEKVRVAADESTLDAIRRVALGVSYSCRQGFCSSCMTRVIAGEVDHRDHRLTADERSEYMLTCVSRAASGTLAVDLDHEGRTLP